jgi:hypothetical protein
MQITRNQNLDWRSFGVNTNLRTYLDYRLEPLTRVRKTYVRLKFNIVIYTPMNVVGASKRVIK